MNNNNYENLPFGKAFRQAKNDGREIFNWNGKQYHTYTREELLANPKKTEELATKYQWNKKMRAEFGLDIDANLKDDPGRFVGESSRKPEMLTVKSRQPKMLEPMEMPQPMNTYNRDIEAISEMSMNTPISVPPTMQHTPEQRATSERLQNEILAAMIGLPLSWGASGLLGKIIGSGSKGLLNNPYVGEPTRKGLAKGMKALQYEKGIDNPAGWDSQYLADLIRLGLTK